MAHTNETPNLKLSQYVGTDKPTYLGDYNSDMLKIDQAVGTLQGSTGDYDARITRIEGNQTEVDKAVKAVTETVNSQATEINGVKEDIETKAPINHADSFGTYGVGTETNYGHVKLTDVATAGLQIGSGTAATPAAVAAAVQPYANLTALLQQALNIKPFMFGDSGLQKCTPGGSLSGGRFNNFHWQWINGTLHVTGRESITGTFGTSFIVWPAGMMKVDVPSGTVGDYVLSYGSVGNDNARYLARLVYNTTTAILRIDSQFLSSSSTPVWLDLHAPCGCDTSQIV